MTWDDYIGIPYLRAGRSSAGCDCYGLVWLLFRDLRGIVMPRYDNAGDDRAVHSAMIVENRKNWLEVAVPNVFDVVCFRFNRLVTHMGMMIDETRFLHSWGVLDSVCEDINHICWRHRVDGFFRYQG